MGVAVVRTVAGCLMLGVLLAGGLTACVPTGEQHGSNAGPTPAASTSSTPPLPDDTSTVIPEPTPVGIEPVIVVAGIDVDGLHVSSSGYVAGVVEDGGVCTFVFAGAGSPVEVTTVGRADVRTTSCGLVQLPIDQLARGSWTVSLSYLSESAPSTVSEQTVLEIP
jgi:hypothetical protein